MQVPLEITFRGLDNYPAMEELIRQKVAKLEQVCDHIISCRVAVEQEQKRRETGNPIRVRVEVRLPPKHDLAATYETRGGKISDELPVVFRDAFEAMRRQVVKVVEKQQDKTKYHPDQQVAAVVTKLFPREGYGFLKTPEGVEVYFHENSVLNQDFDRLEVGTGVTFMAEEGEEGLQATTVHLVDKPGVRPKDSGVEAASPPLGWEGKKT
ncbi:MAG: HPF/RaiA family ribosome-associated protein [Desulfohalobiaceae bacterium]